MEMIKEGDGMMEEKTAEDNAAVVGDEMKDITAEIMSTEEAEQAASDGVTEVKPPVEGANTSEPEETSEKELPAGNSDYTSPDEAVSMKEVNEEPEGSVALEVDSGHDEEFTKEDVDTLPISPALEEEEEEEEEVKGEEESHCATPHAGEADDRYESYAQILQGLQEERDKATQRNGQLQTKLAEYLRGKAGGAGRLDGERTDAALQREYDKCMGVLAGLRKHLACESEAARTQAEELQVRVKEKRGEVDNEWRALVLLKQEAAVAALSRRLGREAAQARVEAALAAERLREDELTKLRLRHVRLRMRIRRLEAELRDEEEQGRDPLLIQFDQLQAARLEQKREAEKQSEECSKLQRKLSSCLEHLADVKEKLHGSQADVHAMRGQLAAVEAALASKRDVLTRTKQARSRLQSDNLRLKERRGLLGSRVLLRDFEDTADASDRLGERLASLMSRQAEIGGRCGGWKKRLASGE